MPHFDVAETDSTLDIRTDNMRLHYRKGSDPRLDPAALTAYRDNAPAWHYGMADTENLKGTMRTLDGYDGSKGPLPLDNGILSRSGWSVIDDSPATVRSDGSRSLAFGDAVQGIPWVTSSPPTLPKIIAL